MQKSMGSLGLKPLVRGRDCIGRKSALQVVRRADWRFLLPNPHLGRVAYIGTSCEMLLAALVQCSVSLTLASSPNQAAHAQGNHSGFEVVVMRSRSVADAEKAYALLVPGGYLYWEIHRLNMFASFLRPLMATQREARGKKPLGQSATGYLACLGFCDIGVYWHYPNFEACREIVPLCNHLALRYVFSRHSGGLTGQCKLAAGRFLLKTRLLIRLIPCVSVIAHKRHDCRE